MAAEETVEQLIKNLKSFDSKRRAKAAYALGELGNKEAVLALITALRDSHKGVRMAAAWALGKLGDIGAVAPLIEALNDKEPSVQSAAALALANLHDSRAFEPIVAIFGESEGTSDTKGFTWAKLFKPFEPIRLHYKENKAITLVIVLANLGDQRGVPVIHSLLEQYGRETSFSEVFIWALGMLGEADVLPDLIELKEHKIRDGIEYGTFEIEQIDEAITAIKARQE